jgi:hypothetical protein
MQPQVEVDLYLQHAVLRLIHCPQNLRVDDLLLHDDVLAGSVMDLVLEE